MDIFQKLKKSNSPDNNTTSSNASTFRDVIFGNHKVSSQPDLIAHANSENLLHTEKSIWIVYPNTGSWNPTDEVPIDQSLLSVVLTLASEFLQHGFNVTFFTNASKCSMMGLQFIHLTSFDAALRSYSTSSPLHTLLVFNDSSWLRYSPIIQNQWLYVSNSNTVYTQRIDFDHLNGVLCASDEHCKYLIEKHPHWPRSRVHRTTPVSALLPLLEDAATFKRNRYSCLAVPTNTFQLLALLEAWQAICSLISTANTVVPTETPSSSQSNVLSGLLRDTNTEATSKIHISIPETASLTIALHELKVSTVLGMSLEEMCRRASQVCRNLSFTRPTSLEVLATLFKSHEIYILTTEESDEKTSMLASRQGALDAAAAGCFCVVPKTRYYTEFLEGSSSHLPLNMCPGGERQYQKDLQHSIVALLGDKSPEHKAARIAAFRNLQSVSQPREWISIMLAMLLTKEPGSQNKSFVTDYDLLDCGMRCMFGNDIMYHADAPAFFERAKATAKHNLARATSIDVENPKSPFNVLWCARYHLALLSISGSKSTIAVDFIDQMSDLICMDPRRVEPYAQILEYCRHKRLYRIGAMYTKLLPQKMTDVELNMSEEKSRLLFVDEDTYGFVPLLNAAFCVFEIARARLESAQPLVDEAMILVAQLSQFAHTETQQSLVLNLKESLRHLQEQLSSPLSHQNTHTREIPARMPIISSDVSTTTSVRDTLGLDSTGSDNILTWDNDSPNISKDTLPPSTSTSTSLLDLASGHESLASSFARNMF